MAFALGVCVLLLLIAASIGPATASRQARTTAIQPIDVYRSDAATQMFDAPPAGPPRMEVHGEALNSGPYLVVGYSIAALLPTAAPPPGVSALPGPGSLIVSPALAELLASAQGSGLRPRLAGRVVGIIGPAGLPAPESLLFYRGIAPSTAPLSAAELAVGWGATPVQFQSDPGFSAVDEAVVVTGIVILIVPLLVFISVASRIGGPARIRRLAAIRLVGATRSQIRRFSAAEALLAAAGGLALGAIGYLLTRVFAGSLAFGGDGFFPADLTPTPIMAVLIMLVVPLLAMASVSAGQRGAAVDPLGVSRFGRQPPRRLWWRLMLALVAALALFLASRGADSLGNGNDLAARFVPGVAAAMIAVPVLAPYLAEKLSSILPTGGIGWQLAVRRIRANSGTPTRSISGLAVVLCAAVTMLPLLAYAGARVGENTGSTEPSRAGTGYLSVVGTPADLETVQQKVSAAANTSHVSSSIIMERRGPGPLNESVTIAPCSAVLGQGSVAECADGDVLQLSDQIGPASGTHAPGPGSVVLLELPGSADPNAPLTLSIRLPQRIDTGTADWPQQPGLFLTPGALHGALDGRSFRIDVWLHTGQLDDAGLDRVRNSLAGYGWRVDDSQFGVGGGVTHLGQMMTTARTGLIVGGTLILLVAVLNMMVLTVEQMTERRRALAMAVASGVPRSMLARSTLLEAVIPAVVSVILADVAGVGIVAALNPLLRADLRFNTVAIVLVSVATVVVVAGITAASLPALRRLTSPDSLRTE